MSSKRSRTAEVFAVGERVWAKYEGVEYNGTIRSYFGDRAYLVAFESDEGLWVRSFNREHIRRA
jgi:hypothetical protein